MNGVAASLQLLAADAGIGALIDVDASPSRITGGTVSRNVTLPALAVQEISSVDRNIPNPGSYRHVTDRVQVTGMARTYPDLVELMQAVTAACADQFPTVSGLTRVVVHTDGAGPDFMDDQASLFMKTQDFRVSYSEAR